jgi:hypothetical protein
MSTSTGQPRDEAPAVPVISVTRGKATPADLAAVLAVLLMARSVTPDAPAAEPARSALWARHSRVRTALPRPGPHSWRATALPR